MNMPHLPIRPNGQPGSSPPPRQQTKGKNRQPDNAVLFVNFSNPAVDRKARQNKVAIKKWVTKRQHAAARNQAPPNSLDQSSSSSPVSNYQQSSRSSSEETEDTDLTILSSRSVSPPFRLVGARTVDPFGVAPIDVGDHVSGLVFNYLNAATASLAAFANREHTRGLLSDIRKNAWHPLAIHSRAAYSSMVAFAQVSQGLGDHRAELCMRQHTAQALGACNAELASLRGAESSDALCYAVVLLMLAAQRLDDPDSFHAHARGLSALIHRRARARNATELITWEEQMLIDSETRAMAIGPKRWDTLIAPEKLHPTVPHVRGFHELMENGLCSNVTASFLAQVVATFEICMQAQGDWLVINSLFQHVFVDDGVYRRIWAHSPKQVYLVLCSRLCQHYALWPMRDHPCHTTEFAVASLHRQLQNLNVEEVMLVSPGTMLWVALLGGAGTVSPLQVFFSRLLQEACRRVPGMNCYENVRSYLYENFLWAPGADASAQAFWDSAMLGSPRQSPSPSDSTEGSESGSPRMKKKKRMDADELTVPALARGPADLGFCSGTYRATLAKAVYNNQGG